MPYDAIATILGGAGGQAAGIAAKPWFFATCAFIIYLILTLFLIIFMARRTNGFRELIGSVKGKRMCYFFDDTRTFEMKAIEASSGMIQDEGYGDFIINEKGTYVDKRTRNIVIPFSSSLAVGAEVKHFQAANKLAELLGDEKELQKVSLALANGTIDPKPFDAIKTSVNFNSLKSFANTILPHNIQAKISMEVAKRLKSYGGPGGRQIMVWVIIIIGALLLEALVLYLALPHPGAGSTVINNIYNGTTASGGLAG